MLVIKLVHHSFICIVYNLIVISALSSGIFLMKLYDCLYPFPEDIQ